MGETTSLLFEGRDLGREKPKEMEGKQLADSFFFVICRKVRGLMKVDEG